MITMREPNPHLKKKSKIITESNTIVKDNTMTMMIMKITDIIKDKRSKETDIMIITKMKIQTLMKIIGIKDKGRDIVMIDMTIKVINIRRKRVKGIKEREKIMWMNIITGIKEIDLIEMIGSIKENMIINIEIIQKMKKKIIMIVWNIK